MYFNEFGKHASNKYYVNQDRKDNEKALMKGGSRKQAEDLRSKQEEDYKKKIELMRQAADKRKMELAEYDESEQKKKDDIKQKKADLKKVQEQDAQAKQMYKDRLS